MNLYIAVWNLFCYEIHSILISYQYVLNVLSFYFYYIIPVFNLIHIYIYIYAEKSIRVTKRIGNTLSIKIYTHPSKSKYKKKHKNEKILYSIGKVCSKKFSQTRIYIGEGKHCYNNNNNIRLFIHVIHTSL